MCACAFAAGTASPAARTSTAPMTPICLRNEWLPTQRLQHAPEPVLELDLRLPTEQLTCARDVRLAHLRVVHGKRLVHDLALRAHDPQHRLSHLVHRELA